jgi:hypothetical protein
MVCSQLNYQIALTLLNGFGIASLRPLLERYNPAEIFNTPTRVLLETPNVRPNCIQAIADFKDWDRVKKEIRFIEEKNIKQYLRIFHLTLTLRFDFKRMQNAFMIKEPFEIKRK